MIYHLSAMIIDGHGHYTTAPKPLQDFRDKQVARLKDPSYFPRRVRSTSATTRSAKASKAPRLLFTTRIAGGALPGLFRQQNSVSGDVQRFLMNANSEGAGVAPINVIYNWKPKGIQ